MASLLDKLLWPAIAVGALLAVTRKAKAATPDVDPQVPGIMPVSCPEGATCNIATEAPNFVINSTTPIANGVIFVYGPDVSDEDASHFTQRLLAVAFENPGLQFSFIRGAGGGDDLAVFGITYDGEDLRHEVYYAENADDFEDVLARALYLAQTGSELE